MTDTLEGLLSWRHPAAPLEAVLQRLRRANALAQPLVEADLLPADPGGPAGNTQMAP